MDKGEGVFSVLDNARTQDYHFKAIVIAGMGFFNDAYDLFCITAVTKLIGRLYYFDLSTHYPRKLPQQVNNAISGSASCRTLVGQFFFGWLGDKLGRKKVYGIVTMVGCALGSGLSFGSTSKGVVATRFWYPLSAVITSEYANQRTRRFVSAVFAMQGVGILVWNIMALSVVNMTGFFCTLLVPETKGRSLEDISEEKKLEGNHCANDAREKADEEGESKSNNCVDKSPFETVNV